MELNQEIRIKFLMNSLLITLFLTAPIPFFSQIIKDIPLISLFLGEVSLIFLVVLASFPKAGIREIIKIGCYYLVFISICYALLSFIPVEPRFKLFSFQELSGGIPNLVSVNIIGIVILNTIACLFFGMELSRKVLPGSKQYQQQSMREKSISERVSTEQAIKASKIKTSMKQEVSSLFDLYLKDYELGKFEKNERLENIESALLDNIDMDISGAMCVDKEGNVLHDSVFSWSGYPKEALLEAFKAQNENSKQLGTGSLCQMLFKDEGHWYIVAKYRGNYLILQTEKEEPSPLLETSYRVFKAL